MTIRKILTPPDPVLRARAHKVQHFTPELDRLIDDMIETMRQAPGVGLAAPQLGVSQRVIVVEYAEPADDPEASPKPAKLYAVVNPEIARHAAETVSGTEGCLSIPGYVGDVERYASVTVRGFSRRGKPVQIKARGWLARIFQHEIDHINGVLFIDRATAVYKVEEVEAAAAAD
jgi:peptide deformylase